MVPTKTQVILFEFQPKTLIYLWDLAMDWSWMARCFSVCCPAWTLNLLLWPMSPCPRWKLNCPLRIFVMGGIHLDLTELMALHRQWVKITNELQNHVLSKPLFIFPSWPIRAISWRWFNYEEEKMDAFLLSICIFLPLHMLFVSPFKYWS